MPIGTRSTKQATLRRSPVDFRKWEGEFKRKLTPRSKAADGLRKWIAQEDAVRTSTIALTRQHLESHGIEPSGLSRLPQPHTVRGDLMQRLYHESVPNVQERTRAKELDKTFLIGMNKLARSADKLINEVRDRDVKLWTQDGFFTIPLDGVLQHCIQLSQSIRVVSGLVKRTHIYPTRIADCCMSLVLEMEDRCGLSQRECHALIRIALLAHGCTEDEVKDFNEELTERGTIGGKKESLREKVLKSVDILSAQLRKN
jgi:hypothetical protein